MAGRTSNDWACGQHQNHNPALGGNPRGGNANTHEKLMGRYMSVRGPGSSDVTREKADPSDEGCVNAYKKESVSQPLSLKRFGTCGRKLKH